MHKLYFYALLLASCFLLSACPYSSNVPLEGKVMMDKALLGNWESEDNNLSEIIKVDDYEYLLTGKTLNEKTGKYEKFIYSLTTSVVGGVFLLNIKAIAGDLEPDGYYYVKYTLTNKVIKLTCIDDKLFEDGKGGTIEFKSSSNLTNYIRAKLTSSELFDEDSFYLFKK